MDVVRGERWRRMTDVATPSKTKVKLKGEEDVRTPGAVEGTPSHGLVCESGAALGSR